MSHGLFSQDNPFSFGGGESSTSSVGDEERGERSWRGGGRRGGDRGRRGGDRGGSQGYRGRGRGRGRGGGGRGRGGGDRMREEDEDGDVRIEGKRWSEKGGLKKISPSYQRGVFSRLGGRDSSEEGGGGREEGKGVFVRLNWGGGSKTQQWHKVTIARGGNHDQDRLIQALENNIDASLQPSNVHVIKDKLMFFLENPRTASQLKRLGRVDIENDSLFLKVHPSPPPRPNRGEGGGGGGGGERDRDGDQQMWGERESRDHSFRGGRGRPWERGGRGGRREGAARVDGDTPMLQDTTSVLLSCLGQRYDVITKSLDLSNIYNDQVLQANGVRGVMYNKEFVSSILELVGTNCPQLLSLDLSSNRLQHVDAYTTLPTICPGLQILNLSDNEFRSVSELERMGCMSSVTTLVLEGNPFSQGGLDVMSVASTLRKIFPNIQNVDGQDLPSPVKFDLPVSAGQLPPTQKGFVVNDQVQTLVVEFVKQYYSLYDGDNREKLFEAYAEDAVFSLSVSGASSPRDHPMDQYMPLSHNLARMKDPSRKQSLVKHGRIDIVQCLRDLPPTKNHLTNFNVDVMRATQDSTAFTIYGFFSEVGGSRMDKVPVRAFTRTFMLMAIGSGIAVANDQMTLRPASREQQEKAYSELSSLQQQSVPAPQQNLEPVLENPLQASSTQQLPSLQLEHSTVLPSTSNLGQPPPPSTRATGFPSSTATSFLSSQDEAVMRIAQTTSMNLEWSRKCLVENEWDFNKAVTAFTLLNGQGKIPPEAFQ